MASLEQVLIYLTLLSNIAIALAIIDLAASRIKIKTISSPLKYLGKNALIFSLIVALAATLGSLYFSIILGYPPCDLCWYQRILVYPQVVLLAVALFRKSSRAIFYYTIPLSVIGAAIALYQYVLQLGVANLPCPVTGLSVSCAQTIIDGFGYITMPFMSLSIFIMLIILAYLGLKHNQR